MDRRHLCKSVSSEKHTISGRAQESAQCNVIRTFPSAVFASRLMVSAHAEPDIHLLSKTPGESAQKIEFVFSASPETIRREPLEFDPLRSVGYRRDLAACASKNPDVFVLSLVLQL